MTDDDTIPYIGPDFEADADLAARVARLYLETPAATPGMAARCAQSVLQQSANSTLGGGITHRRHWLVGIAAVAAILLVTFTMRNGGPAATRVTAPAAVASATVTATTVPVGNGETVHFELLLPNGAAKVAVVGDFNGWDTTATPMSQEPGKGAWSAKVTLLPGRHIYAYIVNGERWIVDPLAPQVSNADYGPANALVVEGGTR